MAFFSDLRALFFHPSVFFKMKQDEGLIRPLVLMISLSCGIGFIYIFTSFLLFFSSSSYMTPFEIFLEIFPYLVISLIPGIMKYILFILGASVIAFVFIHISGKRIQIRKPILILCYAQSPFAISIIFYFLFSWVWLSYMQQPLISMPSSLPPFMTPSMVWIVFEGTCLSFIQQPLIYLLLLIPFFIAQGIICTVFAWGWLFFTQQTPIFLFSCFMVPGIIWMIVIAIKGFGEFKIISGKVQYIGCIGIILISAIMFAFFAGYLAEIAPSPTGFTTEMVLTSDNTVPQPDYSGISTYYNKTIGIQFLYPFAWQLSPFLEEGRFGSTSISIGSINRREENHTSEEKNQVSSGQTASGYPRHYMSPLSVYGSTYHPLPLESEISYAVSVGKTDGYILENRSYITVDNRTGTIIHLYKGPQNRKQDYSGIYSNNGEEGSDNAEMKDILWVEANDIRYDFIMTTYASAYDEYHQDFDAIINSVKFTPGSSDPS